MLEQVAQWSFLIGVIIFAGIIGTAIYTTEPGSRRSQNDSDDS